MTPKAPITASKEEHSTRGGGNKRLVQQLDRRRAILAAAVSCFEKKGVAATTMDEIAKAASITRRTVYHHFTSKNEILEAAVEQHGCESITNMMHTISSEQPFADMIVASTVYLIETMPNEPFYRVQVSDKVGLQAGSFYFNLPRVQKTWIKAFQPAYIEALRKRTINPELHLEDILMWTGRLVLSFLQYPNAETSKSSITVQIENFFGRALRSVSAENS